MSEDSEDGVIPHHLGIVMDGNGRWAQARGLPRVAGHQAGVQVVRRGRSKPAARWASVS